MSRGRPIRDLTGERVNMLTVLREAAGRAPGGQVRWLCRCDCGNTLIVPMQRLVRCMSYSCGCTRDVKPEFVCEDCGTKFANDTGAAWRRFCGDCARKRRNRSRVSPLAGMAMEDVARLAAERGMTYGAFVSKVEQLGRIPKGVDRQAAKKLPPRKGTAEHDAVHNPDSSQCRSCAYRSTLSSSGSGRAVVACQYMEKTRQRRPPRENGVCTVYKPGKRRKQ